MWALLLWTADDAGDVAFERPEGLLRRARPHAGVDGHSSPRRQRVGGRPPHRRDGRGLSPRTRPRGGRGAGAQTGTRDRRGEVVCADKAARTVAEDVVVDLAATGEGERCRRRGGGHGIVAGVFASAGESARKAGRRHQGEGTWGLQL